jgi:LmbE family N-acetylglucosaminyl deacetylase
VDGMSRRLSLRRPGVGLQFRLPVRQRVLKVLAIGAHSDDIEIGCAATLLRWRQEYRALSVTWVVLSAPGIRAREAASSARALLGNDSLCELVVGELEESYFPAHYAKVKAILQDLSTHCDPDVILTHYSQDAHQDHRVASEITQQAWRNHLILQYEIPKYDGDLGAPNVHVPVTGRQAARKIAHLARHFGSQAGRAWFKDSTFRALMQLRGVECRAESGFAESFYCRKLVL